MEKDFHVDPAQHENRQYLNISTRAWIAVAATVLACIPVIYLSIAGGWDIYLTGMACLAIGGVSGLILLSKLHHLHFEEWFPYWLAERRAPRELIFQPAILIPPKRRARFSAARRLRARIQRIRDRRERRREDEDEAALIAALFPEHEDL